MLLGFGICDCGDYYLLCYLSNRCIIVQVGLPIGTRRYQKMHIKTGPVQSLELRRSLTFMRSPTEVLDLH